jgi:hypothetical protein
VVLAAKSLGIVSQAPNRCEHHSTQTREAS